MEITFTVPAFKWKATQTHLHINLLMTNVQLRQDWTGATVNKSLWPMWSHCWSSLFLRFYPWWQQSCTHREEGTSTQKPDTLLHLFLSVHVTFHLCQDAQSTDNLCIVKVNFTFNFAVSVLSGSPSVILMDKISKKLKLPPASITLRYTTGLQCYFQFHSYILLPPTYTVSFCFSNLV